MCVALPSEVSVKFSTLFGAIGKPELAVSAAGIAAVTDELPIITHAIDEVVLYMRMFVVLAGRATRLLVVELSTRID